MRLLTATLLNVTYPKFTRYELSRMFVDKREEMQVSISELSSKLEVSVEQIKKIESGNIVLNISDYKVIATFLEYKVEDLLSEETDNLSTTSFRAKGLKPEDKDFFVEANQFLLEMVMQKKIRANF